MSAARGADEAPSTLDDDGGMVVAVPSRVSPPSSWAESLGKTGWTSPTGLALDPSSGDVALTGTFNGTTSFGGGIVTSGDAGASAFVVLLDPVGSVSWAHVLANGDVAPDSIAVDGQGHVLIAGEFGGTTDFGGGAVTAAGPARESFLAEYDSSGGYAWARHFSGGAMPSSETRFAQIAFDASGDVYVVGSLSGNPLDLGCGAIAAGAIEFVAELDASGECVWSRAFGSFSSDNGTQGLSVALDPTGNVLVAGGFFGTIDFGAGPMTDPGGGDLTVFVQKFAATGAILWAKSLGRGEATGVGTDASGNVLTEGFVGEWTAPTLFVDKLDPNGAPVWAKTFAGGLGSALAVDPVGDVVISGTFPAALDVGGGSLNDSRGGTFVAAFSPAGEYEWAYAAGAPGATFSYAAFHLMAASPTAVVTTGLFTGTFVVDGKSLTSAGQYGTFLASFRR